jgi:hypothetical protein
VTNREWLSCSDPQLMLKVLRGSGNDDDRKWRLFAVACSRRVWPRLSKGVHRLVEVAERLADGSADRKELERAARAPGALSGWNWNLDLLHWLRFRRVLQGAAPVQHVSEAAALLVTGERESGVEELLPALWWSVKRGRRGAERRGQCGLLRCIFGNPFRAAPASDPDWFTWDGGLVAKLAEAAYAERQPPSGVLDNARLMVLADALEEAGCADAELLWHLRDGGPHVRGCHAVDLLLNKR